MSRDPKRQTMKHAVVNNAGDFPRCNGFTVECVGTAVRACKERQIVNMPAMLADADTVPFTKRRRL